MIIFPAQKSLFLSLVLCGFLFVTMSEVVSAQVDKITLPIVKEVSKINKNLLTYKKITKDVEGISLEGAEAVYYSSGKNLKKITAKIYGETYNASGEFYYKNEELIFAFYKFNRYDTQIGLKKPPKVVKREEKRLYFNDGKPVKLLVGKSSVKQGSKQWENSTTDILDLEKKLRQGMNQ